MIQPTIGTFQVASILLDLNTCTVDSKLVWLYLNFSQDLYIPKEGRAALLTSPCYWGLLKLKIFASSFRERSKKKPKVRVLQILAKLSKSLSYEVTKKQPQM